MTTGGYRQIPGRAGPARGVVIKKKHATQPEDLLRIESADFPGTYWLRVNKDGYLFFNKQAEPSTGDIANSETAPWVDSTTGQPALRFKGKDASGAVFQAAAIPPGPDGLNLVARAGAPADITYEGPLGSRRAMAVYTNLGASTATVLGPITAPTLTATAASADDNSAPWISHTTSTTLNNASGIISADFARWRAGWLPEMLGYVKLGSAITSSRHLVGMFSASPDAVPTPTNIHGAWFRYDTSVDGSAFWRCVTAAGSTPTSKLTSSPVAANGIYLLQIVFHGTYGSNPTSVKFYVNGLLVESATATLPAASQTLGWGARVTNLGGGGGSSRAQHWSRFGFSHV